MKTLESNKTTHKQNQNLCNWEFYTVHDFPHNYCKFQASISTFLLIQPILNTVLSTYHLQFHHLRYHYKFFKVTLGVFQ